MGKESEKSVYIYIHRSESLCWTPEASITCLIYNKKIKFEKNVIITILKRETVSLRLLN